jgi:hypothetical protein
VLLVVVKVECIEQSVGRVLGVANDDKDKVDLADVSQFNKPEEIPSIVFVLSTAVIIDDIKPKPGSFSRSNPSDFNVLCSSDHTLLPPLLPTPS